MITNRRIVLASRPTGAAEEANFRLETAPLPELAPGQVLVRHHYLSLDPYMRGRMNEGRSYAAPQPLGEVMVGGTAGTVVASRAAGFAEGDAVVGMGGWQEHAVVDVAAAPQALFKVDTSRVPLSAYLGVAGMPGVTAWYGLDAICAPRAGETVAVSAAAGAVGSVVGQLAKQKGCRVVGIAGGPEKCAWVTGELGLDACVDYKAAADPQALYRLLREATPGGVDAYFDNVGGPILDAVMLRMNDFGRIAICGLISRYDGASAPLSHPELILVARLKVQGFIVSDHLDVWPRALAELAAGVAQGTLKYRETVAMGLERAPAAFLGLFRGRNFGKQVVKLG